MVYIWDITSKALRLLSLLLFISALVSRGEHPDPEDVEDVAEEAGKSRIAFLKVV